jgi:hypothetical protein
MLQKVLPRKELRRITTRRMASILRDSLHAAFHRRLFHADIIRRTALDVATNRAGKLQDDGPMPEPIIDALRKAGALRPGATVAALCALPGSIEAADAIRLHIHSLRKNAPEAAEPRWVYCIRNNVAELEEDARPAPPPAARIIYGGRWPSRLRRQFTLWHYRPAAVIVFDQTNDFPALAGGWNVHTDLRSPLMGQLERDGVRRRARFLFKWCATVIRCMVFARTVKPYTSTTLYG